MDLSHFASEWLWLPVGAAALRDALAARGHAVEVEVSARCSDPWEFRLDHPGHTGSDPVRSDPVRSDRDHPGHDSPAPDPAAPTAGGPA